jgi:hypothetical protein
MAFSPTKVCVLLTLGLAACGGSTPAADQSSMLVECETQTHTAPYMPDLSQPSAMGTYTGVLVASVPGPPIKGSNDWTVKILDAAGNPVDGLAVTALPKMPEHTHPTSVIPAVTPEGGGLYDLNPVYLFMPGYWTVTLTLTPTTGMPDAVVFSVCIPS